MLLLEEKWGKEKKEYHGAKAIGEAGFLLVVVFSCALLYGRWGEAGGQNLLGKTYYFALGAAFQSGLLFGLTSWLTVKKYSGRFADLGFRRGFLSWSGVAWAGLVNGILLFVMVSFLAGIIGILAYRSGYSVPPQAFAEVVKEAGSLRELAVLIAAGCILAPCSEEVYFRGLLFPLMRSCAGVIPGIWLSAAVFGALHLDIWRFLPLLLGGAWLAWIYQQSRSLYVSIIAHGIWNLIMVLLMWWNF